jgi:hypothetical protein
MRQQAIAIPLIGAVLFGGCGNIYEDLDMGPWYEVGSVQQAPINIPGEPELAFAVLAPGGGREVVTGDLVQLKITVTTNHHRKWKGDRFLPGNPDVRIMGPFVLWLWTGREPPVATTLEKEGMTLVGLDEEEAKWGYLGSRELRRALVGRRVGERLQVSLPVDAEVGGSIPLYGFALEGTGHTLYGAYKMNPWPSLTIADREIDGTRMSEIEILKTCPGRLYRRTALVAQRGWPGPWSNGPTYRRGDLCWSALESRCTTRDSNARLEVGPMRCTNGEGRTAIPGWQLLYQQIYPPEKVPHEYNLDRPELDPDGDGVREHLR